MKLLKHNLTILFPSLKFPQKAEKHVVQDYATTLNPASEEWQQRECEKEKLLNRYSDYVPYFT